MAGIESTTEVRGAGLSVGTPTPEQAKAQEDWLLEHGTPAQKQAIEKRRRRAARRLRTGQ